MKKEWLVKTLTLGIIVLFICMNVNPSLAVDNVKKSPIAVFNGNTLYVGGSGPDNYTSIQDAIDNASVGDTVFVYKGEYHEGNINVEKSINIIGEDKNTTIVDGYGSEKIFRIYTENAMLSGFTLQNTYLSNAYGMGLFICGGYNNTICGNIFKNNHCNGIRIEWSNHHYIHNNTFIENGVTGYKDYHGAGINIWGSSDTIIERNSFIHNKYGIVLAATNIIISRNVIINSTSVGIKCDGRNNDKIFLNDIINNGDGVILEYAYYTRVGGNNIYDNYGVDSTFVNSVSSKWFKNYWGKNLYGPKRIDGISKIPIKWDFITGETIEWRLIPAIKYDMQPAKNLYDIENDSFDIGLIVPRNEIGTNLLILHFLERFPILEKVFSQLI